MAIPHARPGEVIDVRPLAATLPGAQTRVLARSEGLELIRLVVPRGKKIPAHATEGEITVHCLEGRVALTSRDVRRELSAGEMVYLEGGRDHALEGIEDASILLTITFPRGSSSAERPARSEAVIVSESVALGRGGRVDFDSESILDSVDEADQESFPASDPPSFVFRDAPKHRCDTPEAGADPRPRENGLARRRGGRVDFDSADTVDLVDQASQESFPASDPPGFIYCEAPRPSRLDEVGAFHDQPRSSNRE